MDFWLDFMKDLFEEVYKLKDSELRTKALELNEFRDRMNDIFLTGKERSPGTLQELQKYKIIATDIRFLLREYIEKNDPDYLKMMCQSLGL